MSFKVCGGSLRRQIALVTSIGFRMPLLAAEQPGFVSGHRFSDAQIREIGRPFRDQEPAAVRKGC